MNESNEIEWHRKSDAQHSHTFIQLPMHTFPNPELI